MERRRWVSRECFLDLVGGCNLLPGPSSTQVAMALGYTRAGWIGLLVAGICFILPASLAVLALAWAYVRYGGMPQVQGLLYGIKPVMVAIVAQAIWRLGRLALRGWGRALTGLACFAAVAWGAPPLAVLVASGGLTLLVASWQGRRGRPLGFAWLPAGLGGGAGTMGAAGAAGTVGLGPLLLVFLKLGVVVFGSGYVMLTFLNATLLTGCTGSRRRNCWMPSPQGR